MTKEEKQLLLNALGERVWVDIEYQTLTPSSVFIDEQFLGHTSDSVSAMKENWFDLIHPDDKNNFDQHLVAGEEYSPVFNFRFRHADGQYYWVSSGIVIAHNLIKTGWVSHGMIDQENAVQTLLGSAAHDLRSPVNSILGAVQLIQMQLQKPGSDVGDLSELLNLIKISCNTALDYTSDLLEITALESGNFELKLERIDLGQFTQNFINNNRLRALRKKIKVNFTSSNKDVIVNLNKSKFTRVLDNILSNALKFSNSGSEIHVSFEYDDPYHILLVKDSGTGMSAEVLDALFEKFGKSRRPGTLGEQSHGLGMTIIKQIVSHHKGTIDVDSVEGVGTEVRISLKKH
jgi:signal transduction histidine kinase